MIQLRGHHLFCMLGFRGMGYSAEYADNMKRIHTLLCDEPNTVIEIVSGADMLCAKFPCDKPYHCDAVRVAEQDRAFLQLLKLQPSQTITWQQIEKRVQQYATPHAIGQICFDCQWRAYGVCEDGVAATIAQQPLKRLGM